MNYYSTNNKSLKADFKQATIRGQAPDKGLYFPEAIPVLPAGFISEIDSYSKEEIAVKIIRPFTGDTIPLKKLEQIVSDTIDFDFPLVPITKTISALELFHGPT